jgi:phospholipid transport system substrate-binding protein
MRTRLLPLVAALWLVAGSALALAADPSQTVIDLGNRTLQMLNQKNMPPQQREQQFRSLWHEGFDVPYISRAVVGQYWRGANDDQRAQFMKALEDYIVRIYSQRFNEYSGEQFKVLKSTPQGDEAYVNSQIIRPGGAPPVKVDWRLKKEGDGYKIIDVIIEGISMVTTQRDEFSAVIQRNGGQLDALTKALREKTG